MKSMKKMMSKMVILVLFLACITVSVSAEMSVETCAAKGGWYADVHSNPAWGLNVVTTPILDNGRMYSITAGEKFQPDEYAGIWADAQFYSEDGWATWAKPEYPAGTVHSFLQINSNDVNWEDTVNLADHEYTIKFLGQGSPITLSIKDWYDNELENNYCHLPVCIIPEPPSVPEFPSAFLPAAMIIGFLGAVLIIQKTREN